MGGTGGPYRALLGDKMASILINKYVFIYLVSFR